MIAKSFGERGELEDETFLWIATIAAAPTVFVLDSLESDTGEAEAQASMWISSHAILSGTYLSRWN